jgi:hypothetical protein
MTIAGCNQPQISGTTQTGGTSGTDGNMAIGDTGQVAASTTTGGAATSTSGSPAPGGPPTTTDPSPSGTTTTSTVSTDPSSTTGSFDSTTTGDGTTGGTTSGGTTGGTGGEPEKPWKPKGCPAIYAQELLPTFELEISKQELSKLKSEWKAANSSKDPADHPLESFKYGDLVITTATVQLRGNPTWWVDMGKKMQLEVSFNTIDPKGRFMGQRKLLFDAARYNESFLRDRLALAILDDVGVPAPCANNARVMLNGDYLGLFTSIEKVDKEFLERRFEDPEGNLYKRNEWEKKTNDADLNTSDIEALLAVKDVDGLQATMNLEAAVLEWAGEAVIPDIDGAWAGGLNYYLYHDSKTGFNVIPWDLDASFTRLPVNTDPYLFLKPMDHGRPFYKLATDDPVWFKKYIEKLAYVLEHGYKVDVLQARMDAWAAQIAAAVVEDKNKPFSDSDHLVAVKEQRDYVAARAAFLKGWLECWQNGGAKAKNGKCKPA